MYFASESVENIVSHIHSLYAAKVAAFARDDKKLDIHLDRESEDHAIYIGTSTPGISDLAGPDYETRIDNKYLNISSPARSYRVETFRATNTTNTTTVATSRVFKTRALKNALSDAGGGAQTTTTTASEITPDSSPLFPVTKQQESEQMRCYFVYKCNFFQTDVSEDETDLAKISDKAFYEKASDNTKAIYKNIISQVVRRTGPVIEQYEVDGTDERRVIIAYRQKTAPGYFSALSHLYHYYGLHSTRKYVEHFSNGVTIISIYLVPTEFRNQTATTLEELKSLKKYPPIDHSIHQVTKEASLLYCLPQNKFQTLFAKGELSLQEAIYAHSVFIFVTHFLNRLGNEYATLLQFLDPNNTAQMEVLENLKRRLRQETFTRAYIDELMNSQVDLIRQLYLQFANSHYVQSRGESNNFLPTLSYQRIQTARVYPVNELKDLIRRECTNEHQVTVFEAILEFNTHVLKTNFYTPTKVALSFRLNPDFLPKSEYPQPLYGMFLVVGQEFRGFHLRFRDVARGGIRIVKSRSAEAYSINARSLFDENYNLANTQQRKNKDIPEGGSKGVILLDFAHQDRGTQAFQKYIDSLCDLLLPGNTPGIKEPIVDLLKSREILFMGPDENTAGLVDWATVHAKKRGAPWWKSFFTGKSPTLGGIPHDKYGMTSLSVREYVKGIYRKLEIDQSKVTKMQTGGPDGDLGSNEILLSNEKYVSIVDGSGVLCDPQGLDRNEILRLAKKRVMVNEYDTSKLSKSGFFVSVDDKNVTLPTGEVVQNGTAFRNTYHLRGAKDTKLQMFVPCGGRPEAIDINNVDKLIGEDKKSLIPYIVEGANLFITQSAKLRLEKAGAIVFKDASTNKGGVTSSSLEVLASLAFDDAGFFKHMCVDSTTGEVPQFYKDYVKEVQGIIKRNAELEFEALWRESEKTKKPRSILSDELSYAINDLTEELSASSLWEDEAFRNGILAEALPKQLQNAIGLDVILQRVPSNYLRAIFGSYLAGRFIYEMGSSPGQFAFFEYMVEKRKQLGI